MNDYKQRHDLHFWARIEGALLPGSPYCPTTGNALLTLRVDTATSAPTGVLSWTARLEHPYPGMRLRLRSYGLRGACSDDGTIERNLFDVAAGHLLPDEVLLEFGKGHRNNNAQGSMQKTNPTGLYF